MDTAAPRSSGLAAAEARARLAAEGPNTLPSADRHGTLGLLVGVIREPMFLLLIGASAVYLVLGDLREALVLAASMVVVIAITVVQERRTERALEALRDLSSPRALVIRDGAEVRIPGAEVVRGDLLVLREGDRVAADARLGESHALEIDESLLTGESVPVRKRAAAADPESTQVYSGTLVVRGTGLAQVVATGPRTEMGRIGATLARAESGRTRLAEETMRVVRVFAVIAVALCAGMGLLYYVLRGDPLAAVLAGLTLAMALLPEEFPVVLTVFLALGAWRISKHNVLTRRLPAVEMLGEATVLCCDKTGTLTENRMRVMQVWRDGSWAEPARLETAALACEPHPFDPMERAILETENRGQSPIFRGAENRALTPVLPELEKRYPLSEDFLAVCHGWRIDGARVAAMKGAPETVLALCRISDEARVAALGAAAEAATRGMRVLAVARAAWGEAPWPAAPREMPFDFEGLIALADPLRPAVHAAIGLCRRAGIRVVMITGDHPETARAIASQAGIDSARVLSGADIDALDPQALSRAARDTQVFARVRPEQKLKLVEALRAAGEIVAMTGDGVNDAPALRAAHIGVAMGRRGTDVAREAAALVLLEDDFTAIVSTVRLGRRIYDNIRNAMRYLVAVHVPMAGMAFIPLAAGWPLFVFPVHVVFLEFVIDPACSLVFEAERSDPRIMERPPRPPSERLFTPAILGYGMLMGLSVLAVVALTFGIALGHGFAEPAARALAFAALVAGNLALIFANRSHDLTAIEVLAHPNRALWWIVGGTASALLAVTFIPQVAQLFRFEAPAPAAFAAAVVAGFASVSWYDLVKVVFRRRD